MSLPPINNKYLKNDSFSYTSKLNTSCNIRILHPLIHLVSPIKKVKDTLPNKAALVMSSKPPDSIDISKFQVSRLSPISFMKKPIRPKKLLIPIEDQSTENGRVSKLSVHFDRPIKDYFEETVVNSILQRKPLDDQIKEQPEIELDPKLKTDPKAVSKSMNKVKKFTHFKALSTIEVKLNEEKREEKFRKKKIIKKKVEVVYNQFANQGLQTEPSGLDFAQWEVN